jgi:hypothetical protein
VITPHFASYIRAWNLWHRKHHWKYIRGKRIYCFCTLNYETAMLIHWLQCDDSNEFQSSSSLNQAVSTSVIYFFLSIRSTNHGVATSEYVSVLQECCQSAMDLTPRFALPGKKKVQIFSVGWLCRATNCLHGGKVTKVICIVRCKGRRRKIRNPPLRLAFLTTEVTGEYLRTIYSYSNVMKMLRNGCVRNIDYNRKLIAQNTVSQWLRWSYKKINFFFINVFVNNWR